MVNDLLPRRAARPCLGSPGRTTRWLPTRILYVVTEDWYFLSHRLPMARAAKAAGYEVHVATRLNNGKAAIEAEGFVPHALSWQRGSLSPAHSIAGVAELRRLLREIEPDILHNISLKPVLLGTHREPRAVAHRRGQQPDRARHALHRQSSQERAHPSARASPR